MGALSVRTKGYLWGLLGILILTPDTLLLRAMDVVPVNEVMFWRYMNSTLMLIIFVFIQTWYSRAYPDRARAVPQEDAAAASEEADTMASPNKQRRGLAHLVLDKFTSMSRYGWLAGVMYGLSNIGFLWAVKSTYAANVLVIISTSCFFSAILSYFLLGERLKLHTLLACLLCAGGVLFIFADVLFLRKQDTSVFSSNSQTFGNIMALWTAFSSGAYFTLLRCVVVKEGAHVDLIPVNIITCAFVLVFSLFQDDNGVTRAGANGSFLPTGRVEILWLFLQGAFVIPVSYSLLTHASSMICSAEVGMIMTLETVLGPLWVKLAGFDNPPRFTVYGGSIILLALLLHEYINLQEDRALQAGGLIELKPLASLQAVVDPPLTSAALDL